ncbi:hypothetical protein [Actinomadura parmotrematis]|uniref:Uncharacterized protein n=1 Tax=Actinomadura parmotrematis TaxID=2864039 RepID=A0ABS7FXX6_9ACTN|nr:hypothetical protein [Actinomadura parmotrematis]MBW8485283.1 hypothetical protein [Actinomadura parmotrematis]
MSHPQAGQRPLPYDQRRYDQLVQWAVSVLLEVAPAGWHRIDLRVAMTAESADAALAAVAPDGSVRDVPVPPGLLQAAAEVRAMMYRPGEGTWFGTRLTVDRPGTYRIVFNPRFEPGWAAPAPDGAYAADLAAFPRDDAHLPGWLRERAGARG